MATSDEKILQLFVSSPGDVQHERERVDLVVDLLNAEFKGRVQIQTTRWETSFYSSHDTFQGQIPEAAECDAVIAIFGARLGSQLPPGFPAMPTGEPYPSGTAYEVLSAIEARRHGHGIPDIYVFRRPHAPLVSLDAKDRADIEGQWGRLRQFFERWFLTKNGEFLAAFQEFSTTDEFAAKVESCLRQWLSRRGFATREAVWDRILLGSPFPGLAAFDENRRSVFFGRELVIEQAIERLRHAGEPDAENRRSPFLLVLGASGSGKSSLLGAGLLPRLVQPGAIPSIDHWRKALMVPGIDPFLSLAEALFDGEALGDFLRQGTFRTKEILARQLAGDPEIAIAPLRHALDEAAQARQREARFSEPRPARLVLAIDQAERLLLETEPGVATRFAALVAALAHHDIAYVVMALRSDAYARFQSIDALVSLREAGETIDLLAPTHGELEEMVARPVAACDPLLAFEQKNGRSLASQLVADARGGDALPLLQMTLARLYAAEAARGDGLLRFADYNGMDEAVTQTANEALDTLDPAAQAELPALVTGLVRDVVADPLTGAATPVIAALERPAFEAQKPARKALVDAFVAKRLLTTEGDEASQRVRPVHEALLRIWPQALAIVEEAGNLIRVRHALEPIVREWVDSSLDDKARHLDISPALLGGAQRLLERFGDDVPLAMRDFIAQSSAVADARAAREREEQERRLRDAQAIAAANRRTAQRTGAGLALALLLAGLAAWQWRSADAARVEAQAQRGRAENTLNLATKTADDLVFDLGQKQTCVMGMPKPVLKEILDRARSLQEQLLSAGESSLKLATSHADALGELANTQLELGDVKDALDYARQARNDFASISAQVPDNAAFIFNLAVADLTVGDILRQQNDLDGALAAYGQAQATIDTAVKNGKSDARIQGAQSSDFEDVATVKMTRGDYAGALALFRQAQTIATTLETNDPTNTDQRSRLAIVDREIGDVLLKEQDIDGAAAAYDSASTISQSLANENPDDTCLVRDYSLSEERLGETLVAKHDPAGALKAYQAGQDTAVAMALKDPANMQWQYDLAIGYTEIGDTKVGLNDLSGALDAYRSAVGIDKALVAHDATDALWQSEYWVDLNNLADTLTKDGQTGPATDTNREALAFAQSMVARNVADADWQKNVATADVSLGDALMAQKDYDGAQKAYSDGVDLTRKLADAAPNAINLQNDLDFGLSKLAAALTFKQDIDGALAAYRGSEAIVRKIIASEPDDARRRGELAVILISIGHLQLGKGASDDAIAAFQEAITLTKALGQEDRSNKLWPSEESNANQGVGDALYRKGDVQGFVASYRQSLTIDADLMKTDPADDDLLVRNALKQELLGAVLSGQKDFSGAADAFRAGVEVRKEVADAGVDEPTNRRLQMVDDNKTGDALGARQDFIGALAVYRDGLTIARGLDARDGAAAQAHFDLVVSLNAVGWMLSQEKDYADAAPPFDEALPIVSALAKSEASNAAYQRELWLVDVNLGDARLFQGDRNGALEIYLSARDTAAALVSANPSDATAAGILKGSVAKIGFAANAMLTAGEFEAALAALDKATPVAPDQNWLELVRAACLMFLNRPDEARAIYMTHRGETSIGGKPWETDATEGFAYLREHGLTNPLMDEIEKTFATQP